MDCRDGWYGDVSKNDTLNDTMVYSDAEIQESKIQYIYGLPWLYCMQYLQLYFVLHLSAINLFLKETIHPYFLFLFCWSGVGYTLHNFIAVTQLC